MKYLLTIITAFVCMNYVIGQSVNSKHIEIKQPANAIKNESNSFATTPLEFKEKKHDFGKIKKGTPVTYEFDFTNISGKPVLIESVTAQCGCTTPVYPKSGIAKGVSNKITITYNAANQGSFMKQVTVKLLNYTTPIYLVVSGEVMQSAPQKED